jgi:site-specific recombinase
MLPNSAPPLPSGLDSFAERLGAGAAKMRSVRELHTWLSLLAPEAPLATRVAQLGAGARWLVGSGPIPVADVRWYEEPAPTRRLRLLLDALDGDPLLRERLRATLRVTLHEASCVPLLEWGLPNPRGVGAETADRMARRFLPTPSEPRDLGALLALVIPSAKLAPWLLTIDDALLARVRALFEARVLEPALDEAIALAATRASALGLTAELRDRAGGDPVRSSPFYRLPRECDALHDGGAPERALAVVEECRAKVRSVHEHLEEHGVSVDVVYRLEVIAQNLDRLELLARARGGAPEAVRALIGELARARLCDRSLRDIMRTNARLLARKIIERAGESGEHYITRTRKEWVGMLASAGGGGMLTAGTTALKYLVSWMHAAPFVEGFLASANYALSFLAMQLCGFTLATKQPSMTAAALAGAIKDAKRDPEALEPLVTLIARICRSQLAAAIGNIVLVIPAALAFDTLYRARTGHPFLDPEHAEHSLHSLDPFHSGTLFFAALTGLLLWLSSLGAGWLENWITYRRLPDAIAEHRWGRVFGRGTMRWLSRKLKHGVSGIGGNVALGFLLGMLPVVGKFLGLPLEVRHVTLSTGSLTLALSSLGGEGLQHALAPAFGILCIGTLNFGVSFVLALMVALRARAVEHGGARLLWSVVRRFFTTPGAFFFPPASEG